MNTISKSPLRYFQKKGNGRHNAHDYDLLGHDDPFRSGQVAFHPRISFHLNTIDRMIAKPCAIQALFRNFY